MAKRRKQKKRKLRSRQQPSPSLDELRAYVEAAAKEGLVSKNPRGSGVAVLVTAESKLPWPAPSFSVDRSMLINPGKHKSGHPLIGGKIECAQKALLALFSHSLPERVTAKLTRDVDAVVRRDFPKFAATYGETKDGLIIDAMTVGRALKRLREVNP